MAAIAWNEYPRELAYQAGRFIVGSLAANLKPGFGYRRETLLLHLSEAPGAGELEISPHRLDRAFELLERADFIRNEEGFFRFSLQEPVEGEPSRPMILQPTFEILLSPDASPAAKVFTALHCRLLRYDRVAKYELEHDLFLHTPSPAGDSCQLARAELEHCLRRIGTAEYRGYPAGMAGGVATDRDRHRYGRQGKPRDGTGN